MGGPSTKYIPISLASLPGSTLHLSNGRNLGMRLDRRITWNGSREVQSVMGGDATLVLCE